MRLARSLVFDRPGVPLKVVPLSIPDPRAGEVVLRVEMAGVCGTDHHRLVGDLAPLGHPVCFGHEGIGIVDELGEGVLTDRAGAAMHRGDRVYWSPPAPCGKCVTCTIDLHPALCERIEWPARATRANAAAFQEFALVSARSPLFRVPNGVSAEAVIAFGCAMPTAIGGFERLGPVTGTVVVQGVGPVGLAAVVLAAEAGAEQVIAIGDGSARLQTARRLGATETMSLGQTTAVDRRERVRELTDGRGAQIVVEAAGHISAFSEGVGMLRLNGRYLIMGLYSGSASASVDPVEINNRNLRLIGTLGAPDSAYARTVELAASVGERLAFAELVTHRFPLERAEEAIRTSHDSTAIKTVILPGM